MKTKSNYNIISEAWDVYNLKFYNPHLAEDIMKNPEFDKGARELQKSGLNAWQGIDGAHLYGAIGNCIGTIGGGYLGAKLVNKISGKKERIIIKNIIINSTDINDCINQLKKLNTKKCRKYVEYLEKLKKENRSDWKNKMLNSIILKNVIGTTAGALGGSVVGSNIGTIIGGTVGFGLGLHGY